ncbi:MAG: hypothetical protein HY698_02390 [Deltaproteobacteria bacterium]|nr:hypothetical protein [Deltaproteobacteria bacterium]
MEPEDIFKFILRHSGELLGLIAVVGGLIARLFRERAGTSAPPPVPAPVPRASGRHPALRPVVAWGADLIDDVKARLVTAKARAESLAEEIRLERQNRRFVPTLAEHVPRELERVRKELERQAGTSPVSLLRSVQAIETIVEEIHVLVGQRRDPELLAELGDADALAEACYKPIIQFALAEGLPLATRDPVTQIAETDLAIWTGFQPTPLAPIFLPPAFFQKAAWWPALAHEVGHDFLVSIVGLEDALRDELGVPPEDVGTRPLMFHQGGIPSHELTRVYGAWFEEIFCDVFGTLMLGPAYLATMTELFAAEHDPREVAVVPLAASGRRYDVHPPRHLRVLISAMVLSRAGFHAERASLLGEWEAAHTTDGWSLDRLLFPMGDAFLAVTLEAFLPTAHEIVERLYAGPLTCLSGFGLQDISGLDYGPHEHAECERAKMALLAGKVPAARDPRAVVAGAAWAAREKPEDEARILRHARRAIPAVGTSEVRLDGFAQATEGSNASPGLSEIASAMVLREILAPARSLPGRMPLGRPRGAL